MSAKDAVTMSPTGIMSIPELLKPPTRAPSQPLTTNQALVRLLESVGVEYMFGGSGKVNGTMLIALKHSARIRTIMTRNEQAASFMACGYAMFSDKLGVCFSTGGPGEFNLLSGMAVAYSDSLPVLAISGYAPKVFRGKGCLNESTGLFRTPDSCKMFNLTTKKSLIIDDPGDVCDVVEHAVNLAFEGRPGPVHIHLPMDVTEAPVPNYRDIQLRVQPVLPDAQRLDLIAEVVARSVENEIPIVLWIGYGAIRSHAEPELQALVDRYQIPFITTMDAKGILPESHPLSLGVLGHAGDRGAKRFFDQARIVLAVGNSFAQDQCYGFVPTLFEGKRLIHVNIDERDIDKVYKADVGLVSDAKPAVAGILQRLEGRLQPLAEPRPVAREKWYDQEIAYAGGKVHPGQLVQTMSRLLPDDAIVLGDAGSHMLWLNCYLELSRHQVYQNPGSFGPMASHTNGAIGVKCANPDRPVIVGSGDGCYLMAGFELLTAVEHGLPIVWVIFNNGEMNIVKEYQRSRGDEAFLDFRNPDYVLYAHACGAQGFRVERLEDFAPAFEMALRSRKPTLIDVAVDADVYPPYARLEGALFG